MYIGHLSSVTSFNVLSLKQSGQVGGSIGKQVAHWQPQTSSDSAKTSQDRQSSAVSETGGQAFRTTSHSIGQQCWPPSTDP